MGFSEIQRAILSEESKYVSFDIFDTLLLRPLWEPYDLFWFLACAASMKDLPVGNPVKFTELRRKAEADARKEICHRASGIEDITLADIYDKLGSVLRFDEVQRLSLMELEVGLELEFCYPRHSAKALYTLAHSAGKKVLCISDMYLREGLIRKLLQKNGFQEFDRIYVSSECKKGKYTGSLYHAILHDLGDISPGCVVHIGDNIQSDVNVPRSLGLNAFYIPKAKAEFEVENRGRKPPRELKTRCEMALEANLRYDDPFEPKPETCVTWPDCFLGFEADMQLGDVMPEYKVNSALLKLKNTLRKIL